MLALAGVPATGGFIGKFYLIDATVADGYTWLAVFIVIGSMISLGYYLRVITAIWMTPGEEAAPVAIATPDKPVLAGGSDEATSLRAQGEVVAVAVVFGALTLILGIVPSPLFNAVRDAGAALGLA
jgi:NADH-quinone oxidoreductase subunit N